jgi:hypothetical protein
VPPALAALIPRTAALTLLTFATLALYQLFSTLMAVAIVAVLDPGQVAAQVTLFLRLHNYGLVVNQIFWGCRRQESLHPPSTQRVQ